MRQMKDSGIEWIGEIPSDWLIGRVKHAFIRKNDKALQNNPVVLSLARSGVRIRDISTHEGQLAESYFNYNPVDKGDLLLNPMDLYSGANCSISKVNGVISPAYINLKNKNGINSVFYDYYFKLQYWQMAFFSYGKGVSFDNRWTLSVETLMNYPLLLLPYEDQSRIASYLDKKCKQVDTIIAKQQLLIEKLKAYKLSIITETVTKGLDPDVEMKDSGIEWIGKIPKHWGVVKLGKIFSFLGGYAYKSELYVSKSNNQVIRMGNVKNGQILFDASPVYINDEVALETKKYRLQAGTIVFTMTGTKEKRDYFYTHLLTEKDLSGIALFLNQRVGCLIPTLDICPGYYKYLFKESRILDSIFAYETGSANQGNLGIDSINRTKLHFPPIEEQKKFCIYLDKKNSVIDLMIDKKQSIVDKLTAYKKSLIYEVVTGKKEV